MRKKNRFKQKLAAYEQAQPPLLTRLREEYGTQSGVAEVQVDLREAELYHPMSVGAQRELNPELYAYIDEKVYPIPTGVPLRLRLIGVPEAERASVEAILRKHYDWKLRDKRFDLKLNRLKALSLFFIGILMMALYFVLASVISSAVWYEILSIVATFIVWEAADYAILMRHDLKMEYYYAAQVALAEIVFSDFPCSGEETDKGVQQNV